MENSGWKECTETEGWRIPVGFAICEAHQINEGMQFVNVDVNRVPCLCTFVKVKLIEKHRK